LELNLRPDFAPNLKAPRHRWFPFKEGFSAALVSNVLLEIKRSPGILLDPFLGSGTTALEASHWGWSTYGIEVNPFIAFVARIKTEKSYIAGNLSKLAKESLKGRVNGITFKIPRNTTLVEREGLSKWLFNRKVACEFERIRAWIDELEDKKHADLLLLGLIAAMSDVSNGRRDGKCWRYRNGWKLKSYDDSDLRHAYLKRVNQFVEDLVAIERLSGESKVILGDSRKMDELTDLPLEKVFDGVITSPPYPNSFDYTDVYRPEMLLLGTARTAEDLRPYRLESLRSHVQVDWPFSQPSTILEVREVVKTMKGKKLWDQRIPNMINAYFVDLDIVIRECACRVKPGGKIAFVVANSAYAGIVVPVDTILECIYRKHGIAVTKKMVLRKTPGNGYHQQRSQESLREVLLIGQVSS
jgi:DNA modification methylase